MQYHPKSKRGNLLYRYNPETKRIQFWDRYAERSRWVPSQTFTSTYPNATKARLAVTVAGYQIVTYASTFCEPETIRNGA